MGRRIEIELTSARDDGTWTWRAAGAREPKGMVQADLLPENAKVGDVVRAEFEGSLDGTRIASVLPAKAGRKEPQRLELLGSSGDEPLVTTDVRAGKRDRRDDRGPRRNRAEGGDRRGRDRARDRQGPRDRDRDRGRRSRAEGEGSRRDRPVEDTRPKAKRLRPRRVHRKALLESLKAEEQPIAEQVLQGGIPAVRQAIQKQNEALREAGKPEVNADALIQMAERLRPKALAATWRDRADAALENVEELDLRDLRSVVNAAGDAGRDAQAREVAEQLREALTHRVESEQTAWVAEVAENLQAERVVRALRLSSRPPKAGSPLPGDLTQQLIAATNASLTSETNPHRWATVLDALAYSPIRRRVVPESLPEKLTPELRETIARLATRLPEVAHIFDIKPEDAPPTKPARQKAERGRDKAKKGKGKGSSKPAKQPTEPAADQRKEQDKDEKTKEDQDDASVTSEGVTV